MITTQAPLCSGFESPLGLSRRKALQSFGMGLGSLALADLMAAEQRSENPASKIQGPPPKAKRVIFLFQAGGPSQLDLYDWKPKLKACLLYTSPSPRDATLSRMPSSA